MKSFIEEEYNIYIDKIFNNEYFYYNDYKYVIVSSSFSLEKYIKISNYLCDKCEVSTFIINKNGNYECSYKNKKLYLIRVNSVFEKLCIDDVFSISYVFSSDYFDILEYYKSSIDNLEDVLSTFNNEYMNVQTSVDFYIGMAENGISLLGKYKGLLNNLNYITSNIKYSEFNSECFYNPCNLIIGSKYYFYSKYIKYCFYNDCINYEELDHVLSSMEEVDCVVFFSYLLFNDYYFELVDCILEDKDCDLDDVVSKTYLYIELLKYVRNRIKNVKNIQLIEWLG